ncbi:alpha-N-arabinofuranosidase [Actinoplanes sp. SE50]|uniref:arabinofuranosidase catalytic domain-containing protein n=1 Tax=unclassified Actinoplanes TaxID=2626549 RepID=UPI00023ED47C|nr:MULTISPECIES: arabinofuranosidase catalytic domain-containing protein [unclassified Actinoplanes]AEV85620.1 alpha-L-arabinofuranosidase B catalytic [Actinoplanes sp. SE50/110]ATO84013.1 alpha-N-arabinofuranosidase [Actinoplanes sp. SE50]SLM01423.1 alpha-N-arabinofuranosidase [Actinoplanes sp. SE50/110]
MLRRLLTVMAAAVLTATALVAGPGTASAAGTLPCDIYAGGGTPCVAAHSTTRALFGAYSGPLYQVKRWSDGATGTIGVLGAGGYANAAAQDSFCSGTYCTIVKIYDQTSKHNDLTIAPGGGANPTADQGANAAALPITAGGHQVYGIYLSAGNGYRNNATSGVATGSQPEGMYMVTEGTHVNDRCCFDYGNAETNNRDTGNGDMDAINFGTECWFTPCAGGPRVQADLENGLFAGGNGVNTTNTGRGSAFVTAMLKNNGTTTYAIKDGNAQSGSLATRYNGSLPTQAGYQPMTKQGAIILGIGGDNSNGSVGSFFEGVMTSGYPSDATENAVQANIVAVGYTKSVTFPVSGSSYRLTNVTSGKVLDATNCGTANGTPVRQWTSLGNTCQQWRFTSVGANRWTITNVNAGRTLDAVNCGQALGTAVDLWQSLGNTCQQWAVIPAGNGKYELVVENSGMVLDNQNCGTADGTPARLWMWLNNTCQLWSITS